MAQGKRSRIEERDGVLYKECSKCTEWKALEEGFVKDKKGAGGRKSLCKLCDAKSRIRYAEDSRERRKDYYKKYREENKERRAEYFRVYRDINKDYYKNHRKITKDHKAEYDRKYYEENKERKAVQSRVWGRNNPEKIRNRNQRRRARKKSLPNTLTVEQQVDILTEFEGRCALTGDIDNIHLDHVIPLSTGHGGTILGNMIPLRGDLNTSKGNRNIFEWFYANKRRFKLSQDRFSRLIEYLAKVNNLTREEYCEYVYECHHFEEEAL